MFALLIYPTFTLFFQGDFIK